MKIERILCFVAIALLAASCSRETLSPDAAPKKDITFIATIAPKTTAASTRMLEEKNDKLVASWASGDLFSICYTDEDDNSTSATASVDKVNEDGSAIIKATFSSSPDISKGASVSYPAGWDEEDADGNLVHILNQDGDLNGAYRDIRIASSCHFENNDGTLTLKGPSGPVNLEPAYAICKFSIANIDGTKSVSANKLTISYVNDIKEDITITVTPKSANSELFVTMPAMNNTEVWFEATSGTSHYIVRGTAGLANAKFYKTTLNMATVGNVISSDGKFYLDKSSASEAGVVAEAMIAYIGNEADGAAHGLAIAFENAATYKTKEESETAVNGWNDSHAVTGGSWRLPSAYDWQRMFIACGSDHEFISEVTNDNASGKEFSYGSFRELLKEAGGESADFPSTPSLHYWSSTWYAGYTHSAWYYRFDDSTFDWTSKTNNNNARACLAF